MARLAAVQSMSHVMMQAQNRNEQQAEGRGDQRRAGHEPGQGGLEIPSICKPCSGRDRNQRQRENQKNVFGDVRQAGCPGVGDRQSNGLQATQPRDGAERQQQRQCHCAGATHDATRVADSGKVARRCGGISRGNGSNVVGHANSPPINES